MKTDQQLKSDVTAELLWDAAIDPAHVGVAVNNGIVTLSGQVDSWLQKHSVERAVRRVAGVRGIALDLNVKLPAGQHRSDADIAQAVLNALKWHSLVPEERVKVEVEDGYVTLTGEVDWSYQLAGAEQCVRPLVGVRGVTNRITIAQRARPEEIKTAIAAALRRHAEREASRIRIDVDGPEVTLRGEVDSFAEHEAAIGTAFAAKGVTRVIDRLAVA